MGIATERFRQRQAATQELSEIIKDAKNVIVVHYSCESFYDRTNGTSPRITSVACRNLSNAQTASFSIHQVAERNGVLPAAIEAEYNRLEKIMLDEFYEYMGAHKDAKWLHWNMRDINYGFPAIAHRYRVLAGDPLTLHDNNLCDFARLLISLYGPAYTSHPRLTSLMNLNGISDKDFLTGADEARAFNEKDYVKLHQSTLRKVNVMANLIGRIADGKLKTNAKWHEIHGSRLGYLTELLRDHPVVLIIAFLGSIVSIVSFVVWILQKPRSP